MLPAIILAGCAAARDEAPQVPVLHNFTVGQWTNRFATDAELAGVVVQQFPDCPAECGKYEGRHPAMVLYIFKDGRVCQNGFTPDGTITEDFWWHADANDLIWVRMSPVK